jgi:membrane associated rhomboid family serine protease
MLLIPYRSKNPPEQFPYATIGLIAVNVLVYVFTTKYLLEIKGGIFEDYSVSPTHLTVIRLIASMFLHGYPLHIAGNMLFLWVFGAAVEGRLKIPKYLLTYFVAGVIGGLAQCWAEAAIGKDSQGIGASGAIMGIAGAYLYMFPFARIMVFRFFWFFLVFFRIGPVEWLAWWVVGLFMGLNLLNGLLAESMGISGGTGFFAHIGGFGAGLLTVFLLRARRDNDQVSQIQAVRADSGNDVSVLNVTELETILDAPTENMNLVLTYCGKMIVSQGDRGAAKVVKMINQYRQPLLETANADILAGILLRVPMDVENVSGPFLLRLGGKLEQQHNFETAAYIYRRVYDLYGTTPDGGAALMRLARIWEQRFQRDDLALEAYNMYLQHYAKGSLTEDAKNGQARLTAKLNGAPLTRTRLNSQPAAEQVQLPSNAGQQINVAPQPRRPPELDFDDNPIRPTPISE